MAWKVETQPCPVEGCVHLSFEVFDSHEMGSLHLLVFLYYWAALHMPTRHEAFFPPRRINCSGSLRLLGVSRAVHSSYSSSASLYPNSLPDTAPHKRTTGFTGITGITGFLLISVCLRPIQTHEKLTQRAVWVFTHA